MDSTLRVETTNLIAQVLNALYALRPQLVAPTAGSRGADDLANTEGRRNGEPWGSLPVETYLTVVAGLGVATVDHLHACPHTMFDDIDFGPGVMDRCTLEAAGRLAWLLDPNVDVRDRVGRGYALRVRGLRDNARNIASLAEAEPDPAPKLVGAAERAAKRYLK